MTVRKIIEIDEEKCNGCGQCILSCAEGALEIIDGKAKLVGDIYCDGLGACLGECPEGAMTIIDREAVDFDEEAVEELLARNKEAEAPQAEAPKTEENLPCGCSSSTIVTLDTGCGCNEPESATDAKSQLGHWPIKLQLLGPNVPFLKDSDLVLLADCTAAAYPNLHQKILKGKVIAMGCPKLDNIDAHIDRLAEILKEAKPRALTVVYMEVPCCKGFVVGAQKAIEKAGVNLPFKTMLIGRNGQLLEQEELRASA